MDVHIRRTNYKPSEGFEDFCNLHVDNLKQEMERLFLENKYDSLLPRERTI